ncbi:hypothetical protein ONS95_006507 [Cadophora gregata]|uniref:uncharacterized protein n=1 Tax=Cadophora gregata TaxID=51156 RepID=UPI0026DC7674|nr:uncharacterized protein ONS95_006507 [Cadophora gregata]KAK0101331.1 hypothetical protein ONS95_006507 [Cadophora gregata]
MASSEVDMKFLGNFARNIQFDQPVLSQSLFQILGNITMFSDRVIRARKLRRLDTTRDTKSVDLYCRIIWYTRECLKILEEYVLPMVVKTVELKVLAHKLRASFFHLFVLFHNHPPITLKAAIHTPPGLKSPRVTLKPDKGKSIDRGPGSGPGSGSRSRSRSPSDPFRPSSVQPTHPLEGGPVGGTGSGSIPIIRTPPPLEFAPNFLVPAEDFRPFALQYFQEATALADTLLWGSHPLRLSVKVEFTAFLYDCLHERERSRQLAKQTISEVYNATEGMDDQMFEEAAQLVGILGKMMRRGLGTGGAGSGGSEGNRTVSVSMSSPRQLRPNATQEFTVPEPSMVNPI